MKSTTGAFAVLAAAFIGLLMMTSSCKKDTFYKADVTVVVQDTLGNETRIQNAFVRLYAPCVDCDVDVDALTNGNGVASFEFNAKMVLNIEVQKGDLTGSGFIQLEEGETVVEKVAIQ